MTTYIQKWIFFFYILWCILYAQDQEILISISLVNTIQKLRYIASLYAQTKKILEKQYELGYTRAGSADWGGGGGGKGV